MILLVCAEGEQMEKYDDINRVSWGEQMEEYDDTGFVCLG